jgi:hypothetical protein
MCSEQDLICAISLSLILVIHDNMINRTNHIGKHVFVDISRSQRCKNTTCQNEKTVYFSRVKTITIEEKEKTPLDEPAVPRSECRCSWIAGGSSQQALSDDPTVHILVAPDD